MLCAIVLCDRIHRVTGRRWAAVFRLVGVGWYIGICVAGGDTCSYSLRQLDIHSLELLMPIVPAAPLCTTSSDNELFDGLQVASKGGQIGAPNYFIQVLEGKV